MDRTIPILTAVSTFNRISKTEAIQLGQNWYFTGEPCKRGHIAKRGVASRGCYACQVIGVRKYVKKNPNKKRIWDKTYYDKNQERARELGRIRSRRRDKLPTPTRPAPSHCEKCSRLSKRALCLDHCHVTKKFRGWLCDDCNLGLGLLGDGENGILQMLEYLRRAS
jgi:hypothetical protein